MKTYILLTLLTLAQISWAEDDEDHYQLPKIESPSASASSIPSMSPDQAKMLMEKVQQGHKLKEEQKKALEELDTEE
jgi:hypothetical protein